MMIINKKVFLVWFVLLVFLSGCAGLRHKDNPVSEKTSGDAVAEEVVNHPGQKNEMEEKEEEVQITPGVPSLQEPVVETIPVVLETKVQSGAEKKTEKTKNNRFENVKKQLNSAQDGSEKSKISKQGGISFNFDNADLYEVIRTMAEILKINYIFEVNVNGSVTIHTAGELDQSSLFPLFFQILELNGLTAVKEGDLYKITTQDKIPNTPILTRYGRDLKNVPELERMAMQIVPLDYISISKITPTLVPFLSSSGSIIPEENSNILIIIDKINNLKKILQLIDVFDVDVFDNVAHRFFRLENTESKEAIGLINDLLAPYLKIQTSECNIVNIERLNTLVAISSDERILDKLEMFIQKIDTQEDSTDPRIFIYKVKNSDAGDLASLLNDVFGKNNSGTADKKQNIQPAETKSEKDKTPELFIQKPDPKIKETEKRVSGSSNSGISGSSSLSGEIKIIDDDTRNTLIIEAIPSDYLIVKQILSELDILPRQVLINVLILDVNLTDSQTLGVEWSFIKNRPSGEKGLLKANIGADGLTFSTGITDDWLSALSALANEDKANLLSAPSVLASDNMPARINVVTQIPITTSTYDTDGGVTTTSVQYRDTGIILSVTPHINDHGMVSMEIEQEVSSVAESSASNNNPTFFNRNINTSLTVRDRQSIAIGGLISETKSDTDKGVPFLSKLPGIGFLFGQEKKSVRKNELIIVITPRVINNINDIDDVSREFSQGFEGLKNTKRLIELLPSK